MSFRLITERWDREFEDALSNDHSSLQIVCPFIKERTAARLLKRGRPHPLQVITRFNLADCAEGVSDLSALRFLLDSGAEIRGVRNLHSKLYVCGSTCAIVTSANLTEAALLRNHEFGLVTRHHSIIEECRRYFNALWSRAGHNLRQEQVTDWEQAVSGYLISGARPKSPITLGDAGVDVGTPPEPAVLPAWVGEATQSFVKFFGESDNRAQRSMPVIEEVESSGSHWACTFPAGKRPRIVEDGALMFMGRLVKDPDDTLIYGRAVGIRHEPVRDDATPEDIQLRDWKEKWPHYVRVHHAEFIDGPLANGISLKELTTALGADAFASTQRNARSGKGNTDPRKAYMQQAAVQLSTEGMAWLDDQLEIAYRQFGRQAPALLDELDWPAGTRA
jgi:hypothetical protein